MSASDSAVSSKRARASKQARWPPESSLGAGAVRVSGRSGPRALRLILRRGRRRGRLEQPH
eukprot:8527107-Alexandrium_andersonii.AAC.1